MRLKLSAALLCLALFGCASKQVVLAPTEQRVQAEASLRAANESGAARVPEASRHLEFAQQQIADGERLMAEGEQEAAELRFRQAAADADLALALARAVPLEQQARRTTQQVEALRQGQP